MSASSTFNDDERFPRTASPAVGKGFLFAGLFFVGEVTFVDYETPFTLLLALYGGWFYWIYCVHRMHVILAELTTYSYRVPPGKAAGRHAYPWYNIFWILYWSWVFAKYLNKRGRVRIISGGLLGPMLLLSLLLILVDGAVGLTSLFAVTMYMSGKLAKHVEALGEPPPAQPSALPEPGIQSQPVESSFSPAQEVGETRAGDRYRIFGGLR